MIVLSMSWTGAKNNVQNKNVLFRGTFRDEIIVWKYINIVFRIKHSDIFSSIYVCEILISINYKVSCNNHKSTFWNIESAYLIQYKLNH
jgi:hypothetical protein